MSWGLLRRNQKAARKHRGRNRAGFGRRVLMETLEDRCLLSITLSAPASWTYGGQSTISAAVVDTPPPPDGTPVTLVNVDSSGNATPILLRSGAPDVAGTVGGIASLDVTGLNAGSYDLAAQFTDADGNVETSTAVPVTVGQATLIISAVTDSKTYDGTVVSSQTPTVTGLNTAAGDTVTGLSQAFASPDVLGPDGSTLQVTPGYTGNDGNNGLNYSVSTMTAAGTITAADTTLSLASSDPAPVYGEALTITATVAPVPPGGGTPTGSVVFTIDGNRGQSISIVEPLIDGVATLPIPAPSPIPTPIPVVGGGASGTAAGQGLRVGGHTITAVYQSDTADFNSGASASLPLTVCRAATSTALSSSVDTVAPLTPYGHPILFTATITVTPPGGGIPGGWVVFEDASNNNAVLGKAHVMPGMPIMPVADGARPATPNTGVAYLCVSNLSVGTHTIVADYQGNPDYLPSTSPPDTVTIGQMASATLLCSSEPVAPQDVPVTFTAAVMPSFFATSSGMGMGFGNTVGFGTGFGPGGLVGPPVPRFQPPTGAVQFYYSPAGTCLIVCLGTPVTLDSHGVATLTVDDPNNPNSGLTLPVGTSIITATYIPDATSPYAGSNSNPIKQVIGLTPTKTTITPQFQKVQVNTSLSFTITVQPGGTALDGETVTIVDLGNPMADGGASTTTGTTLGTATLENGTATFTLSAGFPTPGLHLIDAVFPGDSNFAGSDGQAVVAVVPLPSPVQPVPPGPVGIPPTGPGGNTSSGSSQQSGQSADLTDQALQAILATPLVTSQVAS
jgi:hypothetical protein